LIRRGTFYECISMLALLSPIVLRHERSFSHGVTIDVGSLEVVNLAVVMVAFWLLSSACGKREGDFSRIRFSNCRTLLHGFD